MEDPVNVFLTVVGILISPELTLCVILWSLGHEMLGIFALSFGSTTSIQKVVKTKLVTREKFVDSKSGRVIRENESIKHQ